VRRVSLTAAPTDLISQGLYNKKVPVVIGSNRDESALFFKSSQDGHYTESQLDGYMEWAYSKPGQAAAIKSIYENSSSGYEVRQREGGGALYAEKPNICQDRLGTTTCKR
jgi:carboxylesterase type B